MISRSLLALITIASLACSCGREGRHSAADQAEASGQAVAADPEPMPATSTAVFHIVSTGQSNSIGGGQMPALTKVSAYGNFKLTPDNSTVVPAGEPTTGYEDRGPTETHATVMADLVTKLTGAQVVVSNSGEGGRDYAWIKKGGTGHAYAHSIAAVTASVAHFGKVIVPGVIFVHGESDAQEGNAHYEADLLELQADYDADIRAITGQTQPVRLYIVKYGGNIGTAETKAAIFAAEDAASAANPMIVQVGDLAGAPLVKGDCCHYTNTEYDKVGELFGTAVAKQVQAEQ